MIDLVIFDWKRTLYDPDQQSLIRGATELLEYLKAHDVHMVLIGKGAQEMNDEVNKLGVREYFKKVIFAEGAKDPNVFAQEITKDDPKKTIFIGDRVRSELEIGNKLGATTIWVKQGKFVTELPENKGQEPDYTVSSLLECLSLLKIQSNLF